MRTALVILVLTSTACAAAPVEFSASQCRVLRQMRVDTREICDRYNKGNRANGSSRGFSTTSSSRADAGSPSISGGRGPSGPSGPSGSPGRPGSPGSPGAPGAPGQPGSPGTPGGGGGGGDDDGNNGHGNSPGHHDPSNPGNGHGNGKGGGRAKPK